MDKKTELKEIEEVLADLETRMSWLRRFVEEETSQKESKQEYKIGDILWVKSLKHKWDYILVVKGISESKISGDYRRVEEGGFLGEQVYEGFFINNKYNFSYIFES